MPFTVIWIYSKMHCALVYGIRSFTLRYMWCFHPTQELCPLKIRSVLAPFIFHICSWTFQNAVLFSNISAVHGITLQLCLHKKYPCRQFHDQYFLLVIHWTQIYRIWSIYSNNFREYFSVLICQNGWNILRILSCNGYGRGFT